MNYLRGYYTAVLKPNFFSRPEVHPWVKTSFFAISGVSLVYAVLSAIEGRRLAAKIKLQKIRMEMVE